MRAQQSFVSSTLADNGNSPSRAAKAAGVNRQLETLMDNVVMIEIRNVYGNERIYPMNTQASLFAAIANTKTLSRDNLAKIRALGFTIEIKQQEL